MFKNKTEALNYNQKQESLRNDQDLKIRTIRESQYKNIIILIERIMQNSASK